MANPVLKTDIFQNVQDRADGNYMTVSDTINKCITLTLIVILFALINMYIYANVSESISIGISSVSAIIAFIAAIVLTFKKELAPALSITYAVLEGAALGGISAMFESAYNGIVFQAITLTFAVLLVMLLLYKTRIIRVTERLRSVIIIATVSIAAVYLISFILGFFNIRLPFLYDVSPIGIGISVVITIVAALNLLLDFDFIEKGSAANMPKYFEWYAAFGLLVTLVWLYLEILRLLSKVRRR